MHFVKDAIPVPLLIFQIKLKYINIYIITKGNAESFLSTWLPELVIFFVILYYIGAEISHGTCII